VQRDRFIGHASIHHQGAARRQQTEQVRAERTTDGIQRGPDGATTDQITDRIEPVGIFGHHHGHPGKALVQVLRGLGSSNQTDRGDVVVAEFRAEQSAHGAAGSVVEDDAVVARGEVLLGFAAQHQHRQGIDEHLGGDLVGNRIRNGHRELRVRNYALGPGARLRENTDPGTGC
jgi:hypothetical protein